MKEASRDRSSAIGKFHALHESGCFVLPNPWDVGSAIYLEHLGFRALATTSAGFAFSKGLPDGPAFVTRIREPSGKTLGSAATVHRTTTKADCSLRYTRR